MGIIGRIAKAIGVTVQTAIGVVLGVPPGRSGAPEREEGRGTAVYH